MTANVDCAPANPRSWATSMRHLERSDALAGLVRVWYRHSDCRFGQMLRMVVGDRAVRHPSTMSDDAVIDGLRAVLRDFPGSEPPPGPYWDTEARRGRSFINGLPRDPARIPRVLTALSAAWESHAHLRLGQVLELALDRGGVVENEYRSRLLLVEDGHWRRLLEALSTPTG